MGVNFWTPQIVGSSRNGNIQHYALIGCNLQENSETFRSLISLKEIYGEFLTVYCKQMTVT